MRWLVLPAVLLVIYVAGQLDSRHRWTHRWAARAEEAAGKRRHRKGVPARLLMQRLANEYHGETPRQTLARWTLERLETTHEIVLR